jgi:putative phosphoesterase
LRILLIGDTHIPERATRIPERLLEIISDGAPWDIVVFTGDLTGREVYDWVRGLGEKVYVVRGNMDYLPLPDKAVFRVGGLRIGVHHGHGVYPRGDTDGLSRIASSMGADILFTGHTHSPFIKTSRDGRILLVNPGSLTGVWGGGGGSMRPSMMIVEVNGEELLIRHVELNSSWEEKTVRITRATRREGKWIIGKG